MTYILTEQLDSVEDATEAFENYQQYLWSVAASFPPGALQLAASQWYHDFSDHRCPHDARLDRLSVVEVDVRPPDAVCSVEISIRLLGAYQDGHIELHYRDVASYQCEFKRPARPRGAGHADWRYDEFRLSDSGAVLHEIEWWHMGQTARWLIEAADVGFSWTPKDGNLGA